MRLRAGLVLALILLVPSASAGSASHPEITDPADTGDSAADITAAWFHAEDGGLRFSIRTVDGSRPDVFGDHVYWVYFLLDDVGTYVSATVGFGNDGVLRGHLGSGDQMAGLNGPAWDRGGFERVANNGVVGLTEDLGRPSTWSGVIPWGSVDGLEKGATISELKAGSAIYQRRTNTWKGGVDTASSDASYTLTPSSGIMGLFGNDIFPILVPAWVLPLIWGGATAAGLGAGWALAAILARKPKRAPVPVPVKNADPPARPRLTGIRER